MLSCSGAQQGIRRAGRAEAGGRRRRRRARGHAGGDRDSRGGSPSLHSRAAPGVLPPLEALRARVYLSALRSPQPIA